MKFCVFNGDLVSDKFDTMGAAIVHAETHGHTLIFFIAGTEITYIRRNTAAKWEVSETGDIFESGLLRAHSN